jgi:hypothetical protein
VHFHVVVIVAFKSEFIDWKKDNPILGYQVVLGMNCKSFGEAASLAYNEALKLHGKSIAQLYVQEMSLTAIDKNSWSDEVLAQINAVHMDLPGLYYASNLLFLDSLVSDE